MGLIVNQPLQIRTVSECNVLRVHLTTLDMSGCSLTDHGVSLVRHLHRKAAQPGGLVGSAR